ncbi:MAG: SMC-Scp complex subunit ScpB, partial [Planctomycetota bacterium]
EKIPLGKIIEAMLFVYGGVLTIDKIQQAFSEVGYKVSRRQIREELNRLQEEYKSRQGGIGIEKVAQGFRMITPIELAPFLAPIIEDRRRQRLSQAAIETLAIIAYKQPITRNEIEAIRGVGAGNIVRNLVELGLVEVVGRSKKARGAYLYGTTSKFLEIFGLESLEDLPNRDGEF